MQKPGRVPINKANSNMNKNTKKHIRVRFFISFFKNKNHFFRLVRKDSRIQKHHSEHIEVVCSCKVKMAQVFFRFPSFTLKSLPPSLKIAVSF